MAGCIDCKHYNSEIGEFIDGEFGKPKRECKLGNTKDMVQWWEDNGTVKREDVSDMPCHEYSDLSKSLKEMIEKLDDINKFLETK